MNAMAVGTHRRPANCRAQSPGRGCFVLYNSCLTLSWHLAQVAGTLNLLIGDSGIARPQNVVFPMTIRADCSCAGAGSPPLFRERSADKR